MTRMILGFEPEVAALASEQIRKVRITQSHPLIVGDDVRSL
jgi:hypothetical protein